MPDSPLEYFPLTVAMNSAFCNRKNEITHLKECIVHQRPVLIISPRRYGKTSLVLQTMKMTKQSYAQMDFFSVIDEEDVERVILKGIGKLMMSMESIPNKALALANEFFDSPNMKASLGSVELSIEIKKRHEKPAYHVLDILERLERLAIKTNKKVTLFMDEFQRIGEIATDQAMESVLRQVAQLTQSISFVFSGSNRHLLNQLFEDRKRPFYKLCEKITLDRISEEAYGRHLQDFSMKIFGHPLPDRVVERIFFYTERHPYYMNLVCSRLFSQTSPDLEKVDAIWEKYLLEERSSVAADVELLSKNQRKLLTVLARVGGAKELLGQVFVRQSKMSKTTIDQSIQFLKKKDYVFVDEKGMTYVLDPLIKAVLAMDD